MTEDLRLKRKYTLRAHDRQMVFTKKPFESSIHVLTKAFIWALYLPEYPRLAVEAPVGDRYKPDLVQFDDNGEPIFWGEAGQVSLKKMRALVRRFKSTHLVFAKWHMKLDPFRKILKNEIVSICRSAPVDLISIPDDSDERFIGRDGVIRIKFKDVHHVRCSSNSHQCAVPASPLNGPTISFVIHPP